MTSILSLGRSRMAGLLAWMALLSLGAFGALNDPAGARALDGAVKVSAVRALVEAPAHVGRLAAIKLTPHRTGDDDHRHNPSGPDPLALVAAILLAARSAEAAAFVTLPLAKVAGWHGAPYAARAPPFPSIG
ncbi:hypothetical protein [Sphingopyxis sp.]|uniref:hypothetical protein n=1 Tax=Sphingopyxis sp. TaxID=1908224 RepID=UPI003BA9D7B9